jgi:hypothetical protein
MRKLFGHVASVGKEMSISRLVVAVPILLLFTRLVDRSEKESCLLLACCI